MAKKTTAAGSQPVHDFVDDFSQTMVLFASKTSLRLVAVLKRGEAYQHQRISSQ